MADRPNLVVITTHDTGRHFGCYGIPTVHTPAIDRLAGEGVRLDNYFAAVPICSASRVSMLTGHYPQTHGQYDLPVWGYEFHDHIPHLSHRMRDAGYQTALMGLQHETNRVDRLAFDERGGQKSPRGGRCNAVEIAEATRDYLQQVDRDRPFYLQVGFFETHSPFDWNGDIPPDHEHGVYVPPYIQPDGSAYDTMARLQGALRQADQGVGMIDQALRDAGLAENTLLIFTTDHGLELPRAKWHLFDAGIEIGLIARWPAGGITGGRVCSALSSNVDFTPTVLDLLGLPGGDDLAGISMADLWTGRSNAPTREHIFGYYSKTDSRCVRTQTEKLMIQAVLQAGPRPPVVLSDSARNIPAHPVALYDLPNDPFEVNNLANDPAWSERRDALLALLWQWMEDVEDPLLAGPTRPTGYDRALAPYHAWRETSSQAGRS